MKKNKQLLEEIISIGNQLTQIKNTESLMESILSEARALVNAEAGSFYICDKEILHFMITQNDLMQQNAKKMHFERFSIPVKKTSISGFVALSGEVLNIPDVYHIPANKDYGFYPEIDKKTGYRTQSMLTIPLKTPIHKVIGILQLINAKNSNNQTIEFQEADIPYLVHFANIAAVALERAEMTRSLIMRMIKMAELRDPMETGAHVNRVGAYSAELYEAWAKQHKVKSKDWKIQKDLLRMAAMLHDAGKVGISDAILKKPGKLDNEEFLQMKKHPEIGAGLFTDEQSDLDKMAGEIALYHHKHWDGGGYPDFNVKHNEIPLMARIVAIADVFDALSSRRCYKAAWDMDKVWNELQISAGSQFDPELIRLFLSIQDEILILKAKYPDQEYLDV